ncbi:MAG: hypothetical protein J6N47_01605 [Lachnospiraceae bacterium]|nr:hypothetical protein [Lachnospiraceae bacterium]
MAKNKEKELKKDIQTEESKNKLSKAERSEKRWSIFIVAVFTLLLAGGSIVGFIPDLRPQVSELEKRELEQFPVYSDESFVSGEYLDNLQSWYADSYPGREEILTAYGDLKDHYGIKDEEIHGELSYGDEIPVVEDYPSIEDEYYIADEGMDPPLPPTPPTDDTASVGGSSEETDNSDETASEEGDATVSDNKYDPDDFAPIPSVASDAGSDGEKFGALYISNGAAYSTYYFSQKCADEYAEMASAYAEELDGVSNVYSMLIPLSGYFYLGSDVKEQLHMSDEKAAFNYIYSVMDEKVTPIPIVDALARHRNEYIYFRTDHHWTARGAYYAYRQYAKIKGFTPYDITDYTCVQFDNFLGSFYSSTGSSSLAATPDTVEAFVPLSTNTMYITQKNGVTMEWDIIKDVSGWGRYSKFNTFIGGDQPYAYIKNPNINDGTSCLVIKESFGNAFVPFLVDHYDEVYVVDYRYYKQGAVTLAKEHEIDDVIFVNNASALSTGKINLMKARMF